MSLLYFQWLLDSNMNNIEFYNCNLGWQRDTRPRERHEILINTKGYGDEQSLEKVF